MSDLEERTASASLAASLVKEVTGQQGVVERSMPNNLTLCLYRAVPVLSTPALFASVSLLPACRLYIRTSGVGVQVSIRESYQDSIIVGAHQSSLP
jgi:hypothetical protein